MGAWEYCRVSWIEQTVAETLRAKLDQLDIAGEVMEVGGTVRRRGAGYIEILGSEQDAERFTDLDGTLARLGPAGWEMVSHTELTTPGVARVFFFKRYVTNTTSGEQSGTREQVVG